MGKGVRETLARPVPGPTYQPLDNPRAKANTFIKTIKALASGMLASGDVAWIRYGKAKNMADLESAAVEAVVHQHLFHVAAPRDR